MPRTIATLPAGSRITNYVSLGVCYGKVEMSPRSRGRYAPFPQVALLCITSSRPGYPSAQRQAALRESSTRSGVSAANHGYQKAMAGLLSHLPGHRDHG